MSESTEALENRVRELRNRRAHLVNRKQELTAQLTAGKYQQRRQHACAFALSSAVHCREFTNTFRVGGLFFVVCVPPVMGAIGFIVVDTILGVPVFSVVVALSTAALSMVALVRMLTVGSAESDSNQQQQHCA